MLDDVVTVPDTHSLNTYFLFLCACACRYSRVHEANHVSEEHAHDMEMARQRQKDSEEVSSTLRSRSVVNYKITLQVYITCITNKLNYNNAATMISRIYPL